MSLILIVLLVALMIPLVAVILDSQVGRAIAARLESGHGADALSEPRLAALEGEVDRLSRELQRLDEESAFLHQLLEKKRAPGALPPVDAND
ncbi:MAG: hypothetical protein WD054_03495 [Gemmatimonadota bacterium]